MIARPLAAALLAMFAITTEVQAAEAPMINADVVKMVKAKLPESTIILAIRSAKPDFDTSADALIKLSAAGVPKDVIDTMLQPAAAGAPASNTADFHSISRYNPEEVVLNQDGEEVRMKYLTPTMRTGARALGFGGVATYAVLHGPAAKLRARTTQPSFLIEVPENAQPESYATLASFAVRQNSTREVLVGGGVVTYETGIHRDRVVPTTSEKLADQSKAHPGFVLYKISPTEPLKKGEYALVTYNSKVRVSGFFLTGQDSFFDFGVDS
ncbi:hypothetical protein [Tahibacter amnicola]|uniref:Uncharacterized protein n=1 Tax=Tahibacter amnicola TaxID=2976241 RepID=A0ABY6BB36_9GAMM|nr:hypothetical protein [Tahibacter amnicola]UXI65846.1 hypothetical protein N4264_13865 [Tahibacter amnicola]